MRRFAFLLMASLLGPATARADFAFAFAEGGTPTSNFTIDQVGQTVDVQVYLTESNGTILADEALFSSGIRLRFDAPSGVAAVQGASDVSGAPAFDFVEIIPDPTSVALTVAAFANAYVEPDGLNRILLGTFRFTGLSSGSVSIRVEDLDPNLDDTVTGFATVLDGLLAPVTATVEVRAVPEPSGLLALSLGGLAVVGWVRRGSVSRSGPRRG